MNRIEEQKVKRKLKILDHAKQTRSVSKTCHYWGYPEIRFIVGKNIMQLKSRLIQFNQL